jgi:hypothetical protein
VTDKSGGAREETIVVYFRTLPTDILSYFHSYKERRVYGVVSACLFDSLCSTLHVLNFFFIPIQAVEALRVARD